MTTEQRLNKEGDLVSAVHTQTSIESGKVLRSVPPLDKKTARLFSTDANNVVAPDGVYEFFPGSSRAYMDGEFREPVAYREFFRVH